MDLVLGSGAADVSIPADVVMTLVRTGTTNDQNFLGQETYVLAEIECWHYGDSKGSGSERDFNLGQEIGATIVLLIPPFWA